MTVKKCEKEGCESIASPPYTLCSSCLDALEAELTKEVGMTSPYCDDENGDKTA